MATTAWRDIKLTASGDLSIEGGDLVLIQDIDAIAQECSIATQLWLGEYAFNEDAGMDWSSLLEKGVADATIAAALRKVISGITGVRSLDKIEIIRNNDRTASIAINLTADSGATTQVQVTV